MRIFSKKIVISILIILTIAGFLVAFVLNSEFSAIKESPFPTSKLNILISGYDSSINGPPRADTIIIASIDLEKKKAGLLFVPRDTRVNIPGHGMRKINAAHAFGGIELVEKTVESFLDISIDYFIETDFEGFSEIINAIGGIKINIKNHLHYVDKAGGLYIDLPAGTQVLQGKEALHYVRYRDDTYGDIGRVRRQQKFINAVIKKLLNPEMIVKLPDLYEIFREAVKTNIPFQDITPFVKLVKQMNLNKIETKMLPGKPEYIEGRSYWLHDKKETKIMVNNLIRSKEYIINQQYKINVLNGNGESGIATRVSDILKKYGFSIKNIGNASHFNYKETVIKYFNKKDKDIVLGLNELLGGEIEYLENEKKDEIIIIIGNDYLDQSQK